ncbi:hypothetical protein [Pararhodobacter aggregans]|uniref:Uncharacterized protein n=1 Tax=Pararhodobacter aggregans TaxID=404875 RepID=A0A2T7URH2_9RHOB|nr:hypothetical protein [Pararhodobacter aggregans]PTX02074.1 hypothetical protein C8N33_106293 [Pararhodobacter aggregans]PVE47246.1 hypothetical protein DDE23_13485 [Pararhodobacter aggregans]
MGDTLSILNDDGAEIIDDLHQVLRVYASGTTYSSAAMSSALQAATPSDYVVHATALGMPDFVDISLCHDCEWLSFGNGRYGIFPVFEPGTGGGFSAFYQFAGQPIAFSLETEFDLADPRVPKGTFCQVSGSGRPFKLTAPLIGGPHSDDWGLQVFDPDGAPVFDSRDEVLAVRYAFVIPQALADHVLLTGESRLIDLPEAMPDLWISLPFFCCWAHVFVRYHVEGGNPRYVYERRILSLTQWDDTRLNLFCSVTEVTRLTPDKTPIFTHDVVVYVARNIP